jgi:hypothetical protein
MSARDGDDERPALRIGVTVAADGSITLDLPDRDTSRRAGRCEERHRTPPAHGSPSCHRIELSSESVGKPRHACLLAGSSVGATARRNGGGTAAAAVDI